MRASRRFRPLMPGGNYAYRQIEHQNLIISPAQCVYVAYYAHKVNNHHFPNMSRLVFVMEAQCVLCEALYVVFYIM